MRKILLIIAVLIGTMASAQVSKEDIRIYINPGHGAFDSDSRPMGTVKHGANNAYTDVNNDTANFFESNTNLQKAFGLLEKLISFGVPFDRTKNQTNSNPHRVGAALDLTQNIVFSRVKSGVAPAYINYTNKDKSPESAYYDRSLSEVAAEVEFNEFDLFISIHSNALTEGTSTNYPLFLYRGTDSQEGNVGSIAVIKSCWSYILGMGHHQWTNKNENIRGDHSFYGSSTDRTYTIPEGSDYVYDETDSFSEYIPGTNGSAGYVKYKGYLGVLKHGVTGFLAEGYFHTYQPARHRYMNWDVCKLEGVAYARGIADYYDWDVSAIDTKGTIYGIVRDKNEKFTHEFYTPNTNTNDVYKPLNNVVVTLKKDNAVVATYTTDDEWNGAFVFNVEPGTYTIECAARRYKSQTMEVSVGAAKCTYPEVFLEKEDNYPDPIKGKKGFNLRSYYDVRVEKESNSLVTILADKTVRRQILRDDKLYVFALDTDMKANVYVFDVAQDKLVKTLTATTAVGDILPLSDIALTTDGYLVGINKCNQAYDGTKNVTAYKWNNGEDKLPEGDAQIWWTSNFAGNWNNGIAGESMIYEGSTYDGKFIYTGTTTASTGNTRLVIVSISEGSYFGYKRNNQDGTYLSTSYVGDTYNMTLSPNADDKIIFDSEKIFPFEIQLNPADTKEPTIIGEMTNDDINTKSNNASYFKYAGKSLMVTPDVNAEGNVSGIKLFDITDGLGNANEIELNGATLAESVACNNASAHGELDIELNSNGEIVSADIELFLAIDGKVTKFNVGDFYDSANLAKNEVIGTANPFAYGLKSEIVEGKLKATFSLNTDATAVAVNIVDAVGNVVATAEGSTFKVEQTVEIDILSLPYDIYTWEVEVEGAVKSTIQRFSSERFYHPSGLDIDNSFESASFGTRFVCEGYNQGKTSNSTGTYVSAQTNGAYGGGLYIFDPQGNQILNKNGKARFYPSWMTNTDHTFGSKTCGADFAKVAISDDGRIFVNRYNFAGDYYLYAESLEKLVTDGDFTSLLSGKTMTNGIYFDGADKYLAGPAQSFDVKGSGENIKLIALSRNDNSIEAKFDKNRVVEYELGTAKSLPTPTSYTALDQKYTISYDRKANLQYDNRGGVWYIQYRGTPTNEQPALIYVDGNGEIKYFEGDGGKSRYQGALSVAPDGNHIVASSASGVISVYEIIRSEDGFICLNETYRLTHNMGGSAYSAAWDIAGNFYLGNASNEVVQGYSLPRTEPTITKAASKYTFIVDEATAIEEVETDENAPVEYYNLQGVKVENPSKGIFIKKQGNKTTKVVL